MQQAPQHTDYASPVLRAASPASSVGTSYHSDQTAQSDAELELPQQAFEQKWQERLQLRQPTQEEADAYENPLLPMPISLGEEEALYERVMRSLRQHVHQLEENELFERVLLRGSQVGLEPKPTSDNIHTLMQNMMGCAVAEKNVAITNGPWNNYGMHMDDPMDSSSASTAGGMRGQGRARSRVHTQVSDRTPFPGNLS